MALFTRTGSGSPPVIDNDDFAVCCSGAAPPGGRCTMSYGSLGSRVAMVPSYRRCVAISRTFGSKLIESLPEIADRLGDAEVRTQRLAQQPYGCR